MPRWRFATLLIVALCLVAGGGSATSARAAEVFAEVSSREVYVGIPFTLTITIRNATSYEMPSVPAVTGLDIGSPRETAVGGMTVIINGRKVRSDQDRRITFPVTAAKPGDFTIGPVTVRADGQAFTTAPIRVTARRADAGDRLIVEVVPEKPAVYLGESADITLKVWIKAYEDSQYNVRLSGTDMWSLIDVNQSAWGDFEEPLRAIVSDRFGRNRPLTGREVIRADAEGQRRQYYLFELAVSLWPQQAGPLEIQPVSVLMQYPVRLERSRSLLSRGDLRLAEAELAVAGAAASPLLVKTPPADGRPPSFTGAVGRFNLVVAAAPTTVAVGDPITLTMTVVDRTAGGSRLELLQPPDLLQNGELMESFRVPTDPLAGVVSGTTKSFTQTVRARHDGVNHVPPIEFAYFDPDAERYVTLASNPIPLTVEGGQVVSAADIVGADGGGGAAPTELTELAGGLLANHTGAELLVATTPWRWSWGASLVVLLPPLAFGAFVVARGRAMRLRHDRTWARRRGARRAAMKQLAAAARAAGARHVEQVAAAVSGYVADRLDLPPGSLTPAEVAARLREREIDDALVTEVESLLVECEQLCFGGGAAASTDSIAERASACIERLERERVT